MVFHEILAQAALFQAWLRMEQWLTLLWIFSMGGCIGSFLNVVIYRLPAGLSIVHPPSRCPRCENAIRGFDNIPVISWLVLRGRCRDCGVAISARYPLVEGAVAMMFAASAWSVLFGAPSYAAQGLNNAEVWGLYALHMTLLCTLFTAAMIEWDGHRPSQWLFAVAGGAGFGVAIIAPQFWMLWSWLADEPRDFPHSIDAISDVMAAFGAAVTLSALAACIRLPRVLWKRRIRMLITVGGLCGLYFGWNAAAWIIAVASTLDVASLFVLRVAASQSNNRSSPPPWTLWLMVATLAAVVFWRQIGGSLTAGITQLMIAGEVQNLIRFPIYFVLIGVLSVAARFLRPAAKGQK